MKKLLLLTLMIVCAFAVVACSNSSTTSKPQSQPPVESEESIVESEVESEPASEVESEPASEVESEPASEVESEPASEVESEPASEPEIETYTITFEVPEGLTAPDAIVVEEGDVVELPTHVGEYEVKEWIIKETGEVFVGGEFTLCESVTLVAVIPPETQPY